jgi:hypothetical protein
MSAGGWRLTRTPLKNVSYPPRGLRFGLKCSRDTGFCPLARLPVEHLNVKNQDVKSRFMAGLDTKIRKDSFSTG